MSEYEIAVQESLQFQRSGQSGEDPLAAYERAFKKLCELPADMLMNNGYSSEEVSLMKAYLSGSVSFDVAAMRASASLSSDLRCTKHISTQYTCVYSWEWDKIPAGEDTAGYALTMVGINENSQSIETKRLHKTHLFIIIMKMEHIINTKRLQLLSVKITSYATMINIKSMMKAIPVYGLKEVMSLTLLHP